MRNGLTLSRVSLQLLATIVCSLAIHPPMLSAQDITPPPTPPATISEKWNYDEIKKVPERARGKHNPFENGSDALRAGGKLFERSCAECHGMKAEGGKWAPSLLRDEVQQASPGAIFWVLSNGVIWHGMPDWSKLPEQQRWQIVTFLKSLKNSPASAGSGGS